MENIDRQTASVVPELTALPPSTPKESQTGSVWSESRKAHLFVQLHPSVRSSEGMTCRCTDPRPQDLLN